VIIIVFAGDVVHGELKACDECLEVKTFSPCEIPWDELAFTNTRDALKDYVGKYFKSLHCMVNACDCPLVWTNEGLPLLSDYICSQIEL